MYETVAKIPAGRVATYGQIALMLGSPGAARTVGWAMRAGPVGLPCHRVIRSDGALAPADVFCGQRDMLENEGVRFLQNGRVDLKSSLWNMK